MNDTDEIKKMVGRVLLMSSKPTYSQKYCVVCGASNKSGISLFTIPDSKRTEWLERVGRTHFLQENYKQNFICEKHFLNEHIIKVWRLGDNHGGVTCHKRLTLDAQPVIIPEVNGPIVNLPEPVPDDNFIAEESPCRIQENVGHSIVEKSRILCSLLTGDLYLQTSRTIIEKDSNLNVSGVMELDDETACPVDFVDDNNVPINEEIVELETRSMVGNAEPIRDEGDSLETASNQVLENTDLLIDKPTVDFEQDSDIVKENVLRIIKSLHNYCRTSEPMHVKEEPEHTSELILESPDIGEEREPELVKMVLEESNMEEEIEILPFDTLPVVEDNNDWHHWPPVDQETIFEHQLGTDSEITENAEESDPSDSETDREKLYYNIDDPDYEPDEFDQICDQNDSDYDPKDDEKDKKKTKSNNKMKKKPKSTKRAVKKAPKTYQCDLCGLCYTNSSTFRSHMVGKHTEERPFMCDKCPRRFKFMHLLNIHNYGIKKSVCEVCNKILCPKRLGTHMKIHLGIKPHKCEICEKCFFKGDSLRRHMLVHTGETPHACTYCDRKFSQEGNLRTHLRTHTLEKPFVCYSCGEAFSHKVSLKTHVLKYHDKGEEIEKGDKKKGCSQRKNKEKRGEKGNSEKIGKKRNAFERK